MPIVVVPEVLREKLGDEGSKALVELLKSVQRETKEDVITLVEERFARRLAEEIGKLRSEMHERFAAVFKEMGELRVELTERIEQTKTELTEKIEQTKTELTEKIEGTKTEIYTEIGKLRAEIHSMRADMIKWMFVFWITQMLTLIGIVIALVKFVG